jgi:heme exporter protein C
MSNQMTAMPEKIGPHRPLSPTHIALLAFAAIGLLWAPRLILNAPTEPTMGFVQRIFYFHVPCAWLAMLGAFTAGVASVIFLFRGGEASEQADRAVAAAELTVIFGLCVIVSGPLWARKAWGKWWDWDVRLTTTALLWIIFVAYLFAMRYGGPGGPRLAAGLALFGAADVPMIYISVSFWRTIHPKTSVVPTLAKGMRPPLYLSFFALLALFIVLFELRRRLEASRTRLRELTLRAQDADLIEE